LNGSTQMNADVAQMNADESKERGRLFLKESFNAFLSAFICATSAFICVRPFNWRLT